MSTNPFSFRLPVAYTIPTHIEYDGQKIPIPSQIRENIRMLFNVGTDHDQAIVALNAKITALQAASTATATPTATSTSTSTSSGTSTALPFMSITAVNSSVNIGFTGATNAAFMATAGAGGITLSLPTARGVSSQIIIVKQVDSGAGGVTINPISGEFIDSDTSYVLSNMNQYVMMISDGTQWQIIANN
jgi:hypothetical protein